MRLTHRLSVFFLILALLGIFIVIFDGCNKDSKEPIPPSESPVSVSKPDVKLINENNPGQEVAITESIVKGKYTVFDFYSFYCGPCMQIAPLLEKLAEKRDDIAIRSIDINRKDIDGIDFDSPVCRQYNIESIPYFKIYDKNGKFMLEGKPAREQINKWMQDAGVVR